MGIVSCMRHTDLDKVKIGYEIVFVGHYFFFFAHACKCHGACAVVRRQLTAINSLLSSWGFQELNSDHRVWRQALLPSEPYCQPSIGY